MKTTNIIIVVRFTSILTSSSSPLCGIYSLARSHEIECGSSKYIHIENSFFERPSAEKVAVQCHFNKVKLTLLNPP